MNKTNAQDRQLAEYAIEARARYASRPADDRESVPAIAHPPMTKYDRNQRGQM